MQLRRLTRLARIDLETEIGELRETDHRVPGHPRRPRRVARRHQGRARRRPGRVRHAPAGRDHLRPGRHRRRGPDRRRGPGPHLHPGRLHQDDAGLHVPHPGPRRPGRAGAPSSERTTSSPRSSTPRPTPTCCSSPTGAGCSGSKAWEIPQKERTARGTAVVNLLPLAPEERIQAIIDTREFPPDRYLFFATRQGQVKKTAFSEYDKSRREGFIAINLRDGDELVRVITTDRRGRRLHGQPPGHDDPVLARSDVRPMGRDAAGRAGHGAAPGGRGRVLRRGQGRRGAS